MSSKTLFDSVTGFLDPTYITNIKKNVIKFKRKVTLVCFTLCSQSIRKNVRLIKVLQAFWELTYFATLGLSLPEVRSGVQKKLLDHSPESWKQLVSHNSVTSNNLTNEVFSLMCHFSCGCGVLEDPGHLIFLNSSGWATLISPLRSHTPLSWLLYCYCFMASELLSTCPWLPWSAVLEDLH